MSSLFSCSCIDMQPMIKRYKMHKLICLNKVTGNETVPSRVWIHKYKNQSIINVGVEKRDFPE